MMNISFGKAIVFLISNAGFIWQLYQVMGQYVKDDVGFDIRPTDAKDISIPAITFKININYNKSITWNDRYHLVNRIIEQVRITPPGHDLLENDSAKYTLRIDQQYAYFTFYERNLLEIHNKTYQSWNRRKEIILASTKPVTGCQQH